MKWYQGDIPQAISLSHTTKAVFLVGIFGADEPSQELEAALDSDDVQAIVASQDFVCLRLEAESPLHQQFAAIYANAKAPSVYCITDKGVPVQIITAPIPAAELRTRLESALNRHCEVLGIRVQGSTSTTFSVASPPPPVPAPVAASAIIEPEVHQEAESSDQQAEGSTEEPSFEEKVRRAKELALAKQLQKQKEEEEDAKRKEIERRQAGKGMAELQRWQKEEEAKRILEERKKEREEEKMVRQRLREQIAQDRAARNARSNVDFVEQSSNNPVIRPTVTTPSASNYAGQARLQFRLPDGSSQTHAFNPDSTLGHVRQFLIDNETVPFRDFSLWVAFPRRQFTSADFGNTLRELGLLPSAALLILPVSGMSHSGSSVSGSNLWTLFAYLMGYVLFPVTFLWSVVQRALPSPATDSSSGSTRATSPPEGPSSSSGMAGRGNKLGGRNPNNEGKADRPSTSTNSSGATENPRKTKENSSTSGGGGGGSGGGNNSSDGNVHRLRTKESDSDDEKATWNGNSTQQM